MGGQYSLVCTVRNELEPVAELVSGPFSKFSLYLCFFFFFLNVNCDLEFDLCC